LSRLRQSLHRDPALPLTRSWGKTTVTLEPIGVACLITPWNANSFFLCAKHLHADWRSRHRRTYCLAHHVTVDGGKRRLMVASLRYLDTFVKMDGAWFFAERRLYVDWLEERGLS
jgi:SnoaL-like domain